jgi:hypothetical protein
MNLSTASIPKTDLLPTSRSLASLPPTSASLDAKSTLELGSGLIHRREDGRLGVQVHSRLLDVQVAASCLLQPSAGDLVAFAEAGPHVWVLHVLQRAVHAPAIVELPAGATLQTASGSDLHLQAATLKVNAEYVDVQANRSRLRGSTSEIVLETCLSVVQSFEAVWQQARLVGKQWFSVFDQHQSHAREHRRNSEQLDAVQAAVVDIRGKSLASIHSEHVAVDAKQLVKIRGGQIHMG